ncbi:MAG TPA: hypothetical protein VGO92_13510 [Acidimicrobiales bacterium]|nr:hypothetical protein [Acidimicrobiales bacterium]
MSLLPLPSRLPARKHVLALVFGLLGVGLMAAAVFTASGLALPFTSRDPSSVRTDAVLVDAPSTTTTTLAPGTTTTAIAPRTRAVAPAAVPGPTIPAAAVTTVPSGRPTTTTSITLPPTTLPLLGGLGRGLGGG